MCVCVCVHTCGRLLYTCTKVVHNTVAAATGLGRHNSRRRAKRRKGRGDNNNKSAIINTAYLILMYYRVIFIVVSTTVARRPGFFSYDTHFVCTITKRILYEIGEHEKPELADERRPGQIEGERRDGFVGGKKFTRFSAKKYK